MMPSKLDAAAALETMDSADAMQTLPPAFDYSGLDAQTVDDLHFAEKTYQYGKKLAERGLIHMGDAIAIAHDALCGTVVAQCDNGKFAKKDDTFRAWCVSIGITKDTAYRLLQVSALMDNSSPRQQKVLKELSPTLLYAVAKPSAPAELVTQVKSGDITTNKQYQEALARLKAEKDRADAAENHEAEAWDMVSKAQSEARAAQDKADAAKAERDAAIADVNGLMEQNTQLKKKADAAEAREEEAWKLREKAEARAKDAENALKQQPIAGVVDKEEVQRQAKKLFADMADEEIDRRAHQQAHGIAADLNAETKAEKEQLQKELDSLRKSNTQLERRMKAMSSQMGDLSQTDFETANYFPDALLSLWNSCKGSYSRLTGEDLESTFLYICNALNTIKTEASLLCRQPEGYDGGNE